MDFKIGMVVSYHNENYVILNKKEILLDQQNSDTFFEIKNLINQKTLLINKNQLSHINIDKSRSSKSLTINNISQNSVNSNLDQTPTSVNDSIAELKSALDTTTSEFIPKRLQENTLRNGNSKTTYTGVTNNHTAFKTTFVEPISITNDAELNPVEEEDDFAPTTMRIRNIDILAKNEKPTIMEDKNRLALDLQSKTAETEVFINSFDNFDHNTDGLNGSSSSKNPKKYRINFSQETKSLFNQPSESGSDILKKSKVFRSFKIMTIWLLVLFSLAISFSAILLFLELFAKSEVTKKVILFGLPIVWGLFLFYFFTYIVYNLVRQYKKIAHYHYQLTKSNRSIKELKKQIEDDKIKFAKLYKKFQDFETRFYNLDVNSKPIKATSEKKQVIN
ncbi:hypothetical protein [Spiroplasma endosymbiont of Panorpa germanica]|uniref:hypothetical protein n=1 Tax=Spiroplasma endosymbiont of Panorpa germanica TaxID=3066314 RepID=UPI0030CE5AEB